MLFSLLQRPALALLLLPLLAAGALQAFAEPTGSLPEIRDDDFVVERFASGIPGSPTTMAIVGDGSGNVDILVLQKHDGQVRLVRDGSVQPIPVLDANVANLGEQGMLGIAAVGNAVYLYYSESDRDGGEAIGKRAYKYEWTGSQLVNPVLLRDLDETQFYHNGGGMVAAPDGAVYLAVGDAGRYGALQNHSNELFEDTSVIMRVDKEEPYYSIGVRNSFGLAIDPVTGRLWDTENGDDDYDEINLVERNSNSGWYPIMGPATEEQVARLPGYYEGYQYSDPEFSWEQPVAPTGLAFAESEALKKFSGSLFVGDCTVGNIYRLALNEARDGFAFTSPHLSADNVANRGESQDEIIFGTGFGCVTDVEVGPDGLLYIVSLSEGTIFRILPEEMAAAAAMAVAAQGGQGDFSMLFYPAMAIAGAGAGFAAYTIRKKSKRT